METDFTKFNAGDKIMLKGMVFTLRDKAHRFVLGNDFPKIRNSVIYHCGPIVMDNDIIAAGPTSSERFDMYTRQLIDKYGIRAVIGKGGMSDSVLDAMKGKAVYMSAIGGAALLYGRNMKIKNVYKREFGMADAIWELEIKDFPVIVTMDSKGNSLHERILEKSKISYRRLMK